MARFKVHILMVIIFLFCAASAMAQETDKVYRLSLDEVSSLAVENNFDIQLAKYDALIAQTDDRDTEEATGEQSDERPAEPEDPPGSDEGSGSG